MITKLSQIAFAAAIAFVTVSTTSVAFTTSAEAGYWSKHWYAKYSYASKYRRLQLAASPLNPQPLPPSPPPCKACGVGSLNNMLQTQISVR